MKIHLIFNRYTINIFKTISGSTVIHFQYNCLELQAEMVYDQFKHTVYYYIFCTFVHYCFILPFMVLATYKLYQKLNPTQAGYMTNAPMNTYPNGQNGMILLYSPEA
jgi:hypothetical protein